MKRDILIGFGLAALLHVSVAISSQWFKEPPPERPAPSVRLDEIAIRQLPPVDIEPTETDVVVDDVPFVPTVPDIPRPDDGNPFTRPVDPPRPRPEGPFVTGGKIPLTYTPRVSGPAIFRSDQVDQPPTAVLQVGVVYPAAMRAKGVNGEVLVAFIVDATGSIRQVRVLRSTAREFEPAAREAVEKWKFRPGRKDGRPVAVQMEVPIRFQLK